MLSSQTHTKRYLLALLLGLTLTACGAFNNEEDTAPQIAAGVSDSEGLLRVESASGVLDFQVSSGLSGEKVPGIRVRVAIWGETRLFLAEDPAGQHYPVAIPLVGETKVRRLVMPPTSADGYNITTADGAINLADYTLIGTLSEAEIRSQLQSGPDEATLIYMYNPASPLALTGATLEVYEAPFDNVFILRAAGEPPEAELALVLVGMSHDLYDRWEHRFIDRYLAARIGQRPDTDLRSDLAFNWSFPVYEIFPAGDVIEVGEDGTASLLIRWRSLNPNPPPPWSIFLTADMEDVVFVEPEAVSIGPDTPSQEFILAVDTRDLTPGDYEVTLFIQPFSEAFGLIEQSMQRTLTFTVADLGPTPTPGPQLENLSVTPADPVEGDILTISASGFTPSEAVLVEFIGSDFNVRDALSTADPSGNFSYLIDLGPVPAGSYDLTVSGTASGMSAATSVSVTDKPPDAIVNRPELNMRQGPSYDLPIVDILLQGDELSVVTTNWDDSWLEVRSTTGQQGWVVTDLIIVNVDLTTVPWNEAWPAPQ